MKASVVLAALFAVAPVFGALLDSRHHHQASRHHIPKNAIKAPLGRRAPSKRAHCAAREQEALSSSSILSAASTQSTQSVESTLSIQSEISTLSVQSTASVHSVAAAATTTSKKPVVKVEVKTSSKPVDQPKPTPKDEPKNNENTGGNDGGNSGGGQVYKGGDCTFYRPGLNACGWTDGQDDFIAAIAQGTWDTFMVDGNSNHNKLCGRMIEVHYQGKSVRAKATDLCPDCSIPTSVDLSPKAFDQLADRDVGRLHGITWNFV